MTTSVLIVNRGPLDVEVETQGKTRKLYPGNYFDLALWHDGQPITIREVPPTKKELSP